MGYTHYWRWNKPIHDAERWAALLADTKTILANLPEHSLSAGGYHGGDPLVICSYDGTGLPEVTDELIAFNGQEAAQTADGIKDLSHESFVLYQKSLTEAVQRGWGDRENEIWNDKYFFAFCKTARKPYDLAVTAVLIRFAYHFAESALRVLSDGNESEWEEGRRLCVKLFGVGVVPFKDDEEDEV